MSMHESITTAIALCSKYVNDSNTKYIFHTTAIESERDVSIFPLIITQVEKQSINHNMFC